MYQTILSEIRKSIEPSIVLGNDVWNIIYEMLNVKHPIATIKNFKWGVWTFLSIRETEDDYDGCDDDHKKTYFIKQENLTIFVKSWLKKREMTTEHYAVGKQENQSQFGRILQWDGRNSQKYYRYDSNPFTREIAILYHNLKTEDNMELQASMHGGFLKTKMTYKRSKIEYHNYLEKLREKIRNYGFNSTGMVNITLNAPWRNPFKECFSIDLEKAEKDHIESQHYKYEGWKKEQDNMGYFLKINSNYELFKRKNTKSKIYCECPYKCKDEIKSLGFLWDAVNKKWFIHKSDLTSEVFHEASKIVKF